MYNRLLNCFLSITIQQEFHDRYVTLKLIAAATVKLQENFPKKTGKPLEMPLGCSMSIPLLIYEKIATGHRLYDSLSKNLQEGSSQQHEKG
jgi:hypothetical protein